ncbi:hypothetical protein [Spirillospora sp. NPDC029432]|uniref:WXG100 family type VII secretion target n=1 Tax=Spirillospora sp. NPDC029432 TaxID=3154599 RepID=UPI003455D388
MGYHSSGQYQDTYTYSESSLASYSDERIRELYDHYKAAGTLGDHPKLQHQYNIVQNSGEPPKVEDYNGQKRETEPSDKWGKKAEDGYDVDPDELRTLRTTILNELDDLKGQLNAVKNAKGFTADKVGGGDIGATWVGMATNAGTVFGTNFDNIMGSIEAVAERLRTTADAYEEAHNKTQQSTGNVQI